MEKKFLDIKVEHSKCQATLPLLRIPLPRYTEKLKIR